MLKIITGSTLMISAMAFSQVGVNTTSPKTTMDVSPKRDTGGFITDNTQILGLQAPRLTRAELTANTATYGVDQKGALVYITDISGGNTTSPRTNIDAIGYYYFDGALWQKVGNGSSAGDTTNDAWVNDAVNTMVKLGTNADGTTARVAGTDLVAKDNGAIGIGTSSPNASAILDITSSNKGILAPRIALVSRTDVTTIVNPATGLLVYNLGTGGLTYVGYVYWNGAEWRSFNNTTTATATIGSLQCLNATLSPTQLTAGTPYSGYMYVPYTDGNGAAYSGGGAIASTGNTGLTATLQPGQLNLGEGSLTYLITGTPAQSSPNLASFALPTIMGTAGCTASVGTLATSGNQIRKIIYNATQGDPTKTISIGGINFRFAGVAGTGTPPNWGTPQMSLTQPANKIIYVGANQQYATDGFQYANFITTFTTANYSAFQNIISDASTSMANYELNIFHIVDVTANAYYRVTFYISGSASNRAFVITAEQF